ncbi:MAG TPA: hypothetical protein VFE78_00815 [Gemmataceae bacterium]|nr:hypothetical protein [Gemmataceae bacterium]
MSAPATVPVTISSEATRRVAELGLTAPFQEMLEYVRQNVAGLQRVEISLALPYDTEWEPIAFGAYTDSPLPLEDQTYEQWGRWKATTFPPAVSQHFVLSILPG